MPAPQTDLQWVDLTDFRAGIYQKSNQALGILSVPAPLGAAQQKNTYRCIALPGGGLGPLPKRIEDFTLAAPEGTAPASGYWIVGFFVYGPMSTGIGGQSRYEDMAFIAVAYRPNASTNQYFRLYRVPLFNSSAPYPPDTINSINSAFTGNNFYETCWFAPTRVNTSDPTLPGNPIVAVGWATPGGSAEVLFASFPDPANPTVTGMANLSTSTTRWGPVYGHQGRICRNEAQGWPMGSTGGSFTDEQLCFTDPPNSRTMGFQQEVFSQEFPTGIGAFGSISAGELFFVKRRGGGVIISGDVANPSITRLPGVTSTGTATTNRAASTPVGLVYAVKEGGIHLWRGGDTSEKISANLDDDSFEHGSNGPPRSDTLGLTNQPIVSTASWGEWILATNNWLYDTTAGGWWKLDDQTANCMYFSQSFSGQFMFGALGRFTQTSTTAYFAWDRTTGATNYSWNSQPIPASIDRLIEVREMVLVAQASTGGTVTVTLTAFDGSTQSEVFTVSAVTGVAQPQRLRPAQGGTFITGYNVVVRIVSDGGSNQAPVVYSLHLGTREAQQVTAT